MIVQLPPFNSTIPATDITHLAEDTKHKLYTALVNTTINCHLCYICYFAFVSFIVFGCHYSHALNITHLRGRRAYWLHNKQIFNCYNEVLKTLIRTVSDRKSIKDKKISSGNNNNHRFAIKAKSKIPTIQNFGVGAVSKGIKMLCKLHRKV